MNIDKKKLRPGVIVSFKGYDSVDDLINDKSTVLTAPILEVHDEWVDLDDDNLVDSRLVFDDILEIIEN